MMLLTTSFSFGQSIMKKIESQACKCMDNIKIESDAKLETFHNQCITTLLEENQKKLLKEYGTTDSDQPEYIVGYHDAQKINTILVSELILYCDKYYEQFKKIAPNEVPLPETSIYGIGEIDSLTKYINLNVNLFMNYCNRAISYTKSEMYKKALLDLDKAIELKPEEAYAYSIKAHIYQKTNDFEQAYIEYKNAYERSKKNELLIFMSLAKRKSK